MIEHEFMFLTLEKIGIGSKFVNLIKMLYKNTNSSVSLPYGPSQKFNINKGLRQSCPISALFFIIAAETLSLSIKNTDYGKLCVMRQELSICQLADDTTIFLNNLDEITKILQIINTFSKASVLRLNIKKCEILPLKDCSSTSICNIPIKNNVKYLGMSITKNNQEIEDLNI